MTQNVDYSKKIITVPNILSLFRICLIPLIMWFYCVREDYLWTTLMLTLSGLTDVVDGIIARKCNMISDFGKAFDPIADKLTQMAMMLCLVTRYPLMAIPLVILVVKEVISGVLNLITIKRTGQVFGALWHGKLNTVLLYVMMVTHLLWFNIPYSVSNALIYCCIIMMLLSGTLYTLRSIQKLLGTKRDEVS